MASAAQHAEMLAAFPYQPYEIQQQLMINLYEALQQSQVGLFESPTGTAAKCCCVQGCCCSPALTRAAAPAANTLAMSTTGTGKTLSIICSTLKWLEDERQAQAAAAAAEAAKAAGAA
jgi:chromosome transmission fidelity protein 1